MYMVMLILDNPRRLDDVLDAWEGVGVSGVTILESTGIHRRRTARGQVAARYSFEGMSGGGDFGNYTLLAIVRGEATAQQCLLAAEGIVGDLDGPNTGVLASWPLALIKGVPQPGGEEG